MSAAKPPILMMCPDAFLTMLYPTTDFDVHKLHQCFKNWNVMEFINQVICKLTFNPETIKCCPARRFSLSAITKSCANSSTMEKYTLNVCRWNFVMFDFLCVILCQKIFEWNTLRWYFSRMRNVFSEASLYTGIRSACYTFSKDNVADWLDLFMQKQSCIVKFDVTTLELNLIHL